MVTSTTELYKLVLTYSRQRLGAVSSLALRSSLTLALEVMSLALEAKSLALDVKSLPLKVVAFTPCLPLHREIVGAY